MLTLQGKKIYLRALEPDDLDFILQIENKEDLWEISATRVPYSRFLIKKYLQNSHRDIYEVKQLRLVICTMQDQTIGLIDIYDLEPRDRRAAVGILLAEEKHRRQGFGSEALELVCNYCFVHLGLHQVYAGVNSENIGSVKLFEKNKFERVGVKRDWILINGEYKNQILYQLINNVH